MANFKMQITEKRVKLFDIEAGNEDEAFDKINKMYGGGEIDLEPQCMEEAMIEIIED